MDRRFGETVQCPRCILNDAAAVIEFLPIAGLAVPVQRSLARIAFGRPARHRRSARNSWGLIGQATTCRMLGVLYIGEGNGPVARDLKTPPTNLRLLSELYGNPLQEDKVARAIDGRAEVEAHGPREMPVWGERFSDEGHAGERQVRKRIAKLVAYLQSIQTGARSASRQGVDRTPTAVGIRGSSGRGFVRRSLRDGHE